MGSDRRAAILLDTIRQHADFISQTLPSSVEAYMEDQTRRLAIERGLQVAIEALVDLAALVWSKRQEGAPQDDEGIIRGLARIGVLSGTDAESLSDLRRFRNVLVHQYAALDHARVFSHAHRAPEAARRLGAHLLKGLPS